MPNLKLADDRELILGERVKSGSLSNLFAGTLFNPNPTVVDSVKPLSRYERIMASEAEHAHTPVLVRVAKSAEFNDLIENAQKALAILHPENPADGTRFYRYYPKNYGLVTVDGKSAHIMEKLEDCVTLADVITAYPDGIDYRDMAWMCKRALVAIGYAHKQGILHGGILPHHLVLTLKDHGGRLVDWSCAVPSRTKVPAMVTAYEDYYPPEVPRSESAREGTDIYMLIKCLQRVLGGDPKTKEFPESVPEPIRGLFDLCLNDSVSMRPLDAFDVHDTFDKLLREAVGKPTFRPFSLSGPP